MKRWIGLGVLVIAVGCERTAVPASPPPSPSPSTPETAPLAEPAGNPPTATAETATPAAPLPPAPAPARVADPALLAPFVGTFGGRRLRIAWDVEDGRLAGELTIKGSQRCSIVAGLEDGRLRGSFRSGGRELPFAATLAGDVLELIADGETYPLTREGSVAEGGAAGPPPVTSSDAFAGAFVGSLEGRETRLTLERSGTRVTGRADASGYGYDLEGYVDGPGLKGQMLDRQTGSDRDFTAELDADGALQLTIAVKDPKTFQVRYLRAWFSRQ